MQIKPVLRILYLVPEFPSQTHAFFWREIQALRSRGADVELVSTRRPAKDACRHEFAEAASLQTRYLFPPLWRSDVLLLLVKPKLLLNAVAYIVSLKESNWPDRFRLLPLILPAARLYQIAKDLGATHLHVHSFANSAHVAALAKVMGGSDYSMTLHGDLDVYGKDHLSKVAQAKFVTCVTEPLRRQLIERVGIAEEKVHLLWMGVDTRLFKPSERAARTAKDPLQLLTVARLHVNKGHRYALRALRLLRDRGVTFRYVIAGDGAAKKDIEEEIASLDLLDCVDLVGTKSESEILKLLQQSDALLLTSVRTGEAAPVAVMEAMACGIPVVCSIIGGTSDMVLNGHDGFLVAQEDVDAIAEAVARLFDSPELTSSLGRNARARAVVQFDCDALAGELLSLIESRR